MQTSAGPAQAEQNTPPEGNTGQPEYTGGNVNYYLVDITDPKRLAPYQAECEDIIEALDMRFAEGCAFKAIWRSCAARTLGKLKAGQDKHGVYDAEKVEYYGGRMVAVRKRLRDAEQPAPEFDETEAAGEVAVGIGQAIADSVRKLGQAFMNSFRATTDENRITDTGPKLEDVVSRLRSVPVAQEVTHKIYGTDGKVMAEFGPGIFQPPSGPVWFGETDGLSGVAISDKDGNLFSATAANAAIRTLTNLGYGYNAAGDFWCPGEKEQFFIEWAELTSDGPAIHRKPYSAWPEWLDKFKPKLQDGEQEHH